jgi:hypothetical protein
MDTPIQHDLIIERFETALVQRTDYPKPVFANNMSINHCSVAIIISPQMLMQLNPHFSLQRPELAFKAVFFLNFSASFAFEYFNFNLIRENCDSGKIIIINDLAGIVEGKLAVFTAINFSRSSEMPCRRMRVRPKERRHEHFRGPKFEHGLGSFPPQLDLLSIHVISFLASFFKYNKIWNRRPFDLFIVVIIFFMQTVQQACQKSTR